VSRPLTDSIGRGALRRMTQRVRVYVGARRVNADLLTGWRKRRMKRGVTLAVEAEQTAGGRVEATLSALHDALQSLRAECGRRAGLRGLDCDVVLADAWVIYDVVPLDLARSAPELADRAICAALADVAGTDPGALAVRWQPQRDGRAFAMAADRRLLAQVQAVLDRFGLATSSLTGEFISVFNAQRRTLTGRKAVLAVGREDGAQIAVVVDGAIAATRYEIGRAGARALAQAAASVMRARGDDTTAPIAYLLDDTLEPLDDACWKRVASPAWASV